MNEKELTQFLENFEIDKNKINEFLEGKKIETKDTSQTQRVSDGLGISSKKNSLNNVFLISKDGSSDTIKNCSVHFEQGSKSFSKNQMQKGELIFIQLNDFLPSKFLLKFIRISSNNIIEIGNEKQALNFTYGKKLLIESTTRSKNRFNKDKSYIVIYQNNILGYADFVKDGKQFYFKNKMNIGDYLKEN